MVDDYNWDYETWLLQFTLALSIPKDAEIQRNWHIRVFSDVCKTIYSLEFILKILGKSLSKKVNWWKLSF